MMVENTRSSLAATLARESAWREAESLDIQVAALRRLIEIAQGDSGQCRRVANFLLAWWNAAECGGFDLTDLWTVDSEIAKDILTVAGLVARRHDYPTAYGFRSEFERLVVLWRPHLLAETEN
jgi:hypothetical protein